MTQADVGHAGWLFRSPVESLGTGVCEWLVNCEASSDEKENPHGVNNNVH